MAPISRAGFARLLRGLSAEEFVSFVADLWNARGWSTEVRDDTVIATRETPTTDRNTVLVRHAAPLLDRTEWSTERTDVTHVVTSGDGSTAADELADSLGANLIERGDVYDMAVYALDTDAREALFRRHFDRSATVDERSGLLGTLAARVRTPRGAVMTLTVVFLLVAAAWGAGPLDDGSSPGDDISAGDTPGIATLTPEPFSDPSTDPTVTPDAPPPTPSAGEGERRSLSYGPPGNVTIGSGDSAWGMFRGDAARTGHQSDSVGPRDDVGVMGRYQADFGIIASPAVVDGILYVGAVDGMLHAIDARWFQDRWSYYLDGAILSSPTVVDETVYVGTTAAMNPGTVSNSTNRMHAIDSVGGRRTWDAATGPISTSSPVLVNESVYVGAADGRVYALDAADGSIRWNTSTNGSVGSSPAVSDETVYVGSQDGRVYALDAADGSIRWNTSTNGSVISTPAVANGSVFVGGTDGQVYALDGDDGSVTWRYATDGDVISSPAIANGTVYVGSQDGRVYALDADSGRQRWVHATNGSVIASPVVANDTVYVGSHDRHVYALDVGTGDERWTFDAGSRIESSPAVASGVLYVGTNDGTVYALAERSEE